MQVIAFDEIKTKESESMMKKRFILIFTVLILVLGTVSFADNEQVTAILSKNISIVYNNEMREFYDVTGMKVYPILHEGTTYLPVRAVSSMFGMNVEWDGENNKIYLSSGNYDPETCKTVDVFISGEDTNVSPILNKSISIEYKEKVQTFTDVNGNVVYPLTYEGTTYLPVRALSNMYGAEIEWNGTNSRITINRNNEISEITNVTIKVINDVLCAVITTKAPLYDYKYFSLTEPNRLVIDLQNSKFGISTAQQDINYSVLQNVKFGSHENNVSRIVLSVEKIDEYSVTQSDDRLTTYFALKEKFKIPDSNLQEKDYTLVASIGNTIYLPDIEQDDNKPSGDIEKGDVVSGDSDNEDVNSGDTSSGDADNENVNSGDISSGDVDNEDNKTLTPEQIAKLAKVTSIVYSPTNDTTKIKVSGNIDFETFFLENPYKYVVDIKGAILSVDGPTEIVPRNKNITMIRFAQNKEDVVRVVFELAEKTETKIKPYSDYLQVTFQEVQEKNVVYEAFDDYATLILKNVKKNVFSVSESTRYNRLTLSFSSSKFKTEAESIEPSDKFVEGIQVKSSKIVINCADEVTYNIKQVDNDVVVTMSSNKKIEDKKFVILLDAGHGGKDPGACYGSTEAERHLAENQEKTYTLAIMLKIKKLLESVDGVEVRTSRTTDVFIDRQGRIDYVLNNEDADMLVSVHINSAATKAYSGTMVLYYNKPGESEDYGITSKELATLVKNNIVKDTGLIDKGVVNRKDIWILEQNAAGQISESAGENRPVTNLPAILCELCFISNDNDHAKLMDEKFQDSAANAIYKGILEAKEQMEK